MRQQLTDDLEAKYKEIRGDSRLLHSTVIKKKNSFNISFVVILLLLIKWWVQMICSLTANIYGDEIRHINGLMLLNTLTSKQIHP